MTGELVIELFDELEQCLSGVHSVRDQTEAHAARVSGKRLRYLLEPIQGQLRDGAGIIKQIKALQDALGELHDAQLFAGEIVPALETAAAQQARRLANIALESDSNAADFQRAQRDDAQPGLLALARRMPERTVNAFAEVETQWLGEGARSFFEQVRTAGRELARRATANKEIERKYLLIGLPEAVNEISALEIEQGWLPGKHLQERLRRVRTPTEERCYRTVKTGSGLTRLEIEEETVQETFETMWPLTEGSRVSKRRYPVSEGDEVWEIDEFLDRELVLAEVELIAEDTRVEVPAWLLPYIVREVTGEHDYMNVNLAK